jgi:hypothetical protein
MSVLTLPPLLAREGCSLAVVKQHIAVLDRDSRELARGPRLQAAWLWTASTAALIERRAEALGFRHELHPEELRFRLWRPGLSRAAAPWQTFPEALAWLAKVERAIRQPRRLRLHLVRSGSITRRTDLGKLARGCEGQDLSIARQAPDEPPLRELEVPSGPITSTQEAQSTKQDAIGSGPGGWRPDCASPAAAQEIAGLEERELVNRPEPITSTWESRRAEPTVMECETDAVAATNQAPPDANHAMSAGTVLVQPGLLVRSGSITYPAGPCRTAPRVSARALGGVVPLACHKAPALPTSEASETIVGYGCMTILVIRTKNPWSPIWSDHQHRMDHLAFGNGIPGAALTSLNDGVGTTQARSAHQRDQLVRGEAVVIAACRSAQLNRPIRVVITLNAAMPAVCQQRAQVWRRVVRFARRVGTRHQVVRELPAAWVWTTERGPPGWF